jgi:hypothetical protein
MSDILAITYEGSYTVAKSDTVADPNGPFAAIYSGGGGIVKFTTKTGITDTVTLVAGGYLRVAVSRVWNGTTTATDIHGLTAGAYRP